MDKSLTVLIPDEIYNHWDELGLTESQRNDDIDCIKDEINKIVSNYLETIVKKCKSTREEIEQIKLSQRKSMLAFGISEEEVQQTLTTIQPINLLQQLGAAKLSYENFKALCSDRIKKLETLVHVAGQLFDTLGTPVSERGEFNEIGDIDYSRERLDRFKCKVEELQQEVDKRKKVVESYREQINAIQKEICCKLTQEQTDVFNSSSLTDEMMEKNEKLFNDVKQIREERIAELNTYAVRMTHLWNLLEVPEKKRDAFIKNYSTISDEVLISCQKEIAKLEKKRDERLPALIQQQRCELDSLYQTLHIAVEGRIIFDEDTTDKQKVEDQFRQMEEEIIRLKDVAVEVHPILTAINELEEIENNFAEIQKEHDPKSYTSRDRSFALQLMKEEKARRRYKVMRPKIQKKLLTLLKKYRKEKGVDFEWDGYPYIDRLQESENNEKIMERFNNVSNSASMPVARKKNLKGKENRNQDQYASVKPVSAKRKLQKRSKLH